MTEGSCDNTEKGVETILSSKGDTPVDPRFVLRNGNDGNNGEDFVSEAKKLGVKAAPLAAAGGRPSIVEFGANLVGKVSGVLGSILRPDYTSAY